jgi:predicted anti-sigma-YlaC factor YlaD
MEQMMEHEELGPLMMEALDGELPEDRRRDMEVHLQNCEACTREWQAVQAIHQLFLQAPLLSPAADFTQRTLARLPNRRLRIYVTGSIYGLLLVSGVVPLLVFIWLALQFGPALNQPAFVDGLLQAGGQVVQLGQAVLGACWQGLGTVGELLGQQPAILGSLFVMIGVVFLWGGVYSQLTRQQRI